MRAILYTGHDEAYAPLASLTAPRMKVYAEKWGMDFKAFSEPPPGLNIYWTGVARGLELLKSGDYDCVFYLDVDQLITNPTISFNLNPYVGFSASRDWGEDAKEPWQFSLCGFIASARCIALFEDVIAMEPPWRDRPFPEQGPMQESVRLRLQWPPDKRINILPRRVFNAVPDAISHGNVPEPWERSDFAAHLTMIPLQARIELCEEIENFLKP